MPEPENITEKTTSQEIYELEWMIRPCEIYKEEYSDCKSIKARFHQYFIFGKTIDCSQWKADYKNCKQWNNNKSKEAYDKLIDSEKKRRLERLKGHYENNVWQKRDKPPEDWNAPLPEWIEKRRKDSYLYCINEKLKNEQTNDAKSSCTIM
ncbi:UPF0545 protein C22orf39 homolog [Anthophora quadrimaculata]